MITVGIDPILLQLGHFALRWYGLIVATAIAVGITVALREARRKGLSDSQFADAIPWVIVGGLVGARLFHVIDHWPDEYAFNPLRALYVWEGGLAIWGGVIGGLTIMVKQACPAADVVGLDGDPAIFQQAGFTAAAQTGQRMTLIGTLAFYRVLR